MPVFGLGWWTGKPVHVISGLRGAFEANQLEVRPRKTSREQNRKKTVDDVRFFCLLKTLFVFVSVVSEVHLVTETGG
jgi:hypothetical protein